MKKGFVRVLWGVYDDNRRMFRRRSKMDKDIELSKLNKYEPEYTTFVFGKENQKVLNDKGIKSILIDDRPIVWDMETQQFRHKIEALKAGMEEFDEMVFLDWDCQPFKPIPDDFWDVLSKKDSLQAVLRMYRRRKALWRKKDQRKIPCASFIYCNDKQVPNKLIEKWEELNCPWSEEVVICRYFEDIMGGWKGVHEYWDRFEPDFFVLEEGWVYDKEKLATKNHCFRHYNESARNRMLRRKKK